MVMAFLLRCPVPCRKAQASQDIGDRRCVVHYGACDRDGSAAPP